MHIGFIGLGNMGNPMARNLIAAGSDVTVHDRAPGAAENLLALGARWADTPRSAAQAADTIITSLPGPPQVQAVLPGENGILAGAGRDSTWIDMSTSSPSSHELLPQKDPMPTRRRAIRD